MRFRRQEPIGPFIADFVFLKHKLIVEADGASHEFSESDETRDACLGRLGYCVLRFENRDIALHPEWVIAEIKAALQTPVPPGTSYPSVPSPQQSWRD